MKICIFSDIHGNGPAFNAAYGMITSEKADINIFLGDLCGYYYDQLEILDRLTAIPKLSAVKGNHDHIFLSIINGNSELGVTYMKKYGYSMENLLNNDTAGLVHWLSGLPESCAVADTAVSCYHGSPWDLMEGYVYPDSRIDRFLDYPELYFLLGHTHYPMVRHIGDKFIINPGSLGQPRNGGWPTYAVVDCMAETVTFREVLYDKKELIARIDRIGDMNPYLKKVLVR
ncbi:MAG: MJ0936 family phosphodiesterase [Candidatus Gottesmanbacteria bacterium GW2011_GWC2_39_8]|uniref:MJ0936 family phosphodiesterase n=1 Tax=Candidatus Gottesmanbacteria bacterium GW2011_GWC2_39_8 TaxID=1618450 RepID=A0A0G0PQ66_9BACT|nr:MAG: MJ0936 family phosphodiesterase [Candidatus Gottesmanbacteria bacterium GW2011_GWC2_39_8]